MTPSLPSDVEEEEESYEYEAQDEETCREEPVVRRVVLKFDQNPSSTADFTCPLPIAGHPNFPCPHL